MITTERAGYQWDPTGRVEAGIRGLIGERLAGLPSHAAATTERLHEITGDYRLAAVYLRNPSAGVADLCELLAGAVSVRERGRLLHDVGRQRFARPGTTAVAFADDLEQALTATGDCTLAYVPDRTRRATIGAFLHDFGTGFRDFVESQHEVPGPNARIRQGVVKSWHLPDGTRVISKRVNPAKPGRFTREQQAYRELARRLAGPVTVGRSRHLRLAPLLATIRDGTSGQTYAIWQWVPGTTVESLLLTPGDHRLLLRRYRDLMDTLLDRGIVWGDMSPRNILMHGDRFHLVDFEKTQIVDGPVPHADRIAFCRGQAGVEELGVLCPPAQMSECLDGYFDPNSWDLHATGPVPFPPRAEVTALLTGRGVTAPTLGGYNRADQQIWQVRAPDTDPVTGCRRYPGLVNFRVEHYLSCASRSDADDYERRTTEIFIAGRRHGCFDDTVHAVADAADELERQFVLAEVAELLAGNDTGPVTPPHPAIRTLTAHIDLLDAARHDPGRFQAASAALRKERV